jgi:oxalate decarboxylase/phosphoglucose isomerase-like protein (cupin superfamily)
MKFRLTQQPPEVGPGGRIRIADSRNFPVSTDIAAALVEVAPGHLREIHWHPNADEWQYYIAGKGRMTVFGAETKARTFDYKPGDVGTVPKAMAHYVENTGDDVLRFPELFRAPQFTDVSLAQWMALTPHELVEAHLNVDRQLLDAMRKKSSPSCEGLFPPPNQRPQIDYVPNDAFSKVTECLDNYRNVREALNEICAINTSPRGTRLNRSSRRGTRPRHGRPSRRLCQKEPITMTSKITDQHLSPLACIYIRQSTPGQVRLNHESTERQSDLKNKAQSLGWSPEVRATLSSGPPRQTQRRLSQTSGAARLASAENTTAGGQRRRLLMATGLPRRVATTWLQMRHTHVRRPD